MDESSQSASQEVRVEKVCSEIPIIQQYTVKFKTYMSSNTAIL